MAAARRALLGPALLGCRRRDKMVLAARREDVDGIALRSGRARDRAVHVTKFGVGEPLSGRVGDPSTAVCVGVLVGERSRHDGYQHRSGMGVPAGRLVRSQARMLDKELGPIGLHRPHWTGPIKSVLSAGAQVGVAPLGRGEPGCRALLRDDARLCHWRACEPPPRSKRTRRHHAGSSTDLKRRQLLAAAPPAPARAGRRRRLRGHPRQRGRRAGSRREARARPGRTAARAPASRAR
jgi:hypothetical protein